MGERLTLLVTPRVRLHDMNVFDIGSNKDYIDTGKMKHEATTTLAQQLAHAQAFFSEETNQYSLNLVLPGYVLEHLQSNENGVLDRLKDFVKDHRVTLLATPYYGSSLHIISQEELKMQLALQEDITHKHFKQKSKIFFSTHQLTRHQKNQLKKVGCDEVLTSQQGQVLNLQDWQADSAIMKKRIASLLKNNTASTLSVNPSFVGMQAHLVSELKGLYDYIVASKDEQLLTSWRLLTHHELIHTLGMNVEEENPYERYTTLMNICNDIAHRIRNVNLASQGEIDTSVNLVNSPSSSLDSLEHLDE